MVRFQLSAPFLGAVLKVSMIFLFDIRLKQANGKILRSINSEKCENIHAIISERPI